MKEVEKAAAFSPERIAQLLVLPSSSMGLTCKRHTTNMKERWRARKGPGQEEAGGSRRGQRSSSEIVGGKEQSDEAVEDRGGTKNDL